jgi:hypothetical protein
MPEYHVDPRPTPAFRTISPLPKRAADRSDQLKKEINSTKQAILFIVSGFNCSMFGRHVAFRLD